MKDASTADIPRHPEAVTFARLQTDAAALGLQLQLPLGAAYDESAGDGLRVADLAPWARGGLLLLSGGRALFERFTPEAGHDPLDRWTRRRVEALLEPLRATGVRAEARYPFWNEPDPLPFQRIGEAAGLGAPTRLGLSLHPTYGSWIAYRALLLFDRPVPDRAPPPRESPCATCAAPCVTACPAAAIAHTWDARSCMDHRLDHGDPCASGCHARLACPVGADQRYAEEALRFHQAASLATARAFRNA